MGWMKSYGYMIMVLLVGCGSVGGEGEAVVEDVFMGEGEKEWVRLVEEGRGKAGVRGVGDVNASFLSWVTGSGRGSGLSLGRGSGGGNGVPLEAARRIPVEVEEAMGMEGVRVGVLLPMSGPLSGLGESLWRASLLGLEDGDRGEGLGLFLYDTEGTLEGSRRAVRQALSEDVDLILGPLLSRSLEGVREEVRGRIPVLSFSNDSAQAEEGVYIFGYTPEQQVRAIVRYVLARGKRGVAAVIPRTLYGKAVYDALQESVPDYGLDLPRVMFYSGDEEDLKDRIRIFSGYDERRILLGEALQEAEELEDEEKVEQLKSRETWGDVPFDSVLLVSGDDVTLRTLSSQLSFFDADSRHGVQFLGLQSWESFLDLGREPSLVGSWYAAPPDEGRKVFEDRYGEIFGEGVLRLATLSYELVLLMTALEVEIRGGVDIRKTLERESGFVGVEGGYRFRRTGRVERVMRVMRVSSRGVRVEEEAPETFLLIDKQDSEWLEAAKEREEREREQEEREREGEREEEGTLEGV